MLTCVRGTCARTHAHTDNSERLANEASNVRKHQDPADSGEQSSASGAGAAPGCPRH